MLHEYGISNVSAETLVGLLRPEQWPWLYAERMEATELMFLADALAGALPLVRWRHGRAFGERSELAWWRQPDSSYQLRLLSEEAPPAGFDWGQPVTRWVARPDGKVATLLHGTLDNADNELPTWSEARIPRWLDYPVAGAPPARVVLWTQVYEYNGIAGLTRLLAVQGWQASE